MSIARKDRQSRAILIALLIAGCASTLLLHRWTLLFHWSVLFRLSAWIVIALEALRRRSLSGLVLLAMVMGTEVGYAWPTAAERLLWLSSLFLRLIKVIIAPLLFSTLVVGIAGHGDLGKVRNIGIKALLYFELVSSLALLIGFIAIDITQAGRGLSGRFAGSGLPSLALTSHSFSETLVNMFPENIAKAVTDNQILQVVVFSLLFGISLALVSPNQRKPVLRMTESLAETMFRFTNIVMWFAPVGVFGAMAYAVGHLGLGIFRPLLHLVITMYAALLAFLLLVLLPSALAFRVNVRRFARFVAGPFAIAFATASSEAALPIALERMEEFGATRETVSLVLPLGYSFNLTGSGIYQSLALVFIAQASGLHLSIMQQLSIFLTLLLSSKGTAGVARGALVVVLAVASSLRLPLEMLPLLFGVDQLMDMGRTGVNVLGNCLAAAVVSKWEGDEEKCSSPGPG